MSRDLSADELHARLNSLKRRLLPGERCNSACLVFALSPPCAFHSNMKQSLFILTPDRA